MTTVIRWSDETLKEFKTWKPEAQARALFLEQNPEYPAYLLVNSFDPLYVRALQDVIGEYRSVHRLQLEKLLDAADKKKYGPIYYTGEPEELFGFIRHLDDPLPFDMPVSLFAFQLRGFNYTKDLPSAIINWSTGTGKSVYAVARTKYMLQQYGVDKVVVLSKAHNKINWQRTFADKGNIRAEVDDEHSVGGNPAKRRERRAEMYSTAPIFIINYEKLKFRPEDETIRYDASGRKRPSSSGDGQELLSALKGQRVLWIWDEMPSKMKSMQTGWYKGTQKLLRKTKQNWQVELTARKMERDPENVYSCTKILDPTVWPNLPSFRSAYARRMSSFANWQVASWDKKKLPELGMRIAHFTHIADKYSDPDIRKEFPEDHWEDVLIDMSAQDRKLYDAAKQMIALDSNGNNLGIMNRLIPLQLICNNPLMLHKSQSVIAKKLCQDFPITDQYCAKLDALHQMLDDIDSKVVIFSKFNELGMHMLPSYLAQWGHTFVVYDGNKRKMQEAHDRFRNDSRIKCFISSDQGSDSIDLEVATTVINYDLPDNDSTLIQRVNRISRLTSQADHVYFANLLMVPSMEEKNLKRLLHKRALEAAMDTPLKSQSELMIQGNFDSLAYMLDL